MEIPRGYRFGFNPSHRQSAKTEINTKRSMNPIMQDLKNGELRFYGAPSMINYGAIPQTVGDVYQVKVFGAIALIDQGEMDWKVLGVNAEDPVCNQLRGLDCRCG